MTIESNLERIAAALEKIAATSHGVTPASLAQEIMCASVVPVTGATITPVEAPKRGPGRPPKSEAKPALEDAGWAGSAPTPPPPADDDFFGDGAPPKEPATIADVRKAVVDYQTRSTPEKARQRLKAFCGAETLKQIKPEQYDAVIVEMGKP